MSAHDDEHVADWRKPSNVEEIDGSGSLEEQIALGHLAAVVGVTASQATRALTSEPFAAEQLFHAFSASKNGHISDLKAGRISELSAAARLHLAAMEIIGDPLPYGVAANGHTLENLMEHIMALGIIDTAIPFDNLFAPNTPELTG